MRAKSKIGIMLLFAVVISGCVEPFDIPSSQNSALLVVESHINDRLEPQVVLLSRSFSIDTSMISPEELAEVEIMNGAGIGYSVLPVPDKPGRYETDPAYFQGVVGERYQLKIKTQNEQFYASEWVTLKASPPIDEVDFQYVEKRDSKGNKLNTVEILVSTSNKENTAQFLRWEWNSTWKFRAPFGATYDRCGEPLRRGLDVCWRDEKSTEVLVLDTSPFDSGSVNRFLLHTLTDETDHLSEKYSILVRQYAIDNGAYQFWKALQASNEVAGDIFDPIPYASRGNIANVDDPNEPVLGYFDASTISEKRIFIETRTQLPELPLLIIDPFYDGCFSTEKTFLEYEIMKEADLPFEIVGPWLAGTAIQCPCHVGWVVTSNKCGDCRLRGTTVKPDFWE